MTIESLEIGEPFLTIKYIEDADLFEVTGKTILLNLSEQALEVEQQRLDFLQSAILFPGSIRDIKRAVVVERFADHEDDSELCAAVQKVWPLAYDVRKEERLKGVQHYMGPKIYRGNLGLGLYHSASVPLNVGLHQKHPWCPVPGFKEVHTQLVGYGKMQQCREKDLSTLYLEEPMAPGTTHRPMYDVMGSYPWHQFETVTPSIFMAVELLPDGAY